VQYSLRPFPIWKPVNANIVLEIPFMVVNLDSYACGICAFKFYNVCYVVEEAD